MPANDERSAVCLLCYDNLGHWPSAKRVDDLDCHYLVRFFMHTLRPCCDLRRQMFCVRQCVLATVNYTITTLITSPSSCPVTAANFLIFVCWKERQSFTTSLLPTTGTRFRRLCIAILCIWPRKSSLLFIRSASLICHFDLKCTFSTASEQASALIHICEVQWPDRRLSLSTHCQLISFLAILATIPLCVPGRQIDLPLFSVTRNMWAMLL